MKRNLLLAQIVANRFSDREKDYQCPFCGTKLGKVILNYRFGFPAVFLLNLSESDLAGAVVHVASGGTDFIGMWDSLECGICGEKIMVFGDN